MAPLTTIPICESNPNKYLTVDSALRQIDIANELEADIIEICAHQMQSPADRDLERVIKEFCFSAIFPLLIFQN